MELWETILFFIGGNVGVLAILAYISKKMIERYIDRNTKRFEIEIKAKADREIERLKNDLTRSVESYKVQLKKSEIIFQKELEAASAFLVILQSIKPEINSGDFDYLEACDEIAHSFGKIENSLKDFFAKFGSVLTNNERDIISSAISTAGYGKCEITGPEISSNTNKNARDLYEKMLKFRNDLIDRVRNQSSL